MKLKLMGGGEQIVKLRWRAAEAQSWIALTL